MGAHTIASNKYYKIDKMTAAVHSITIKSSQVGKEKKFLRSELCAKLLQSHIFFK